MVFGPDQLAVVIGVLVLLTMVYAVVMLGRDSGFLPNKTRIAWSSAVRTLADELGLVHRSLPTAYDSARGTIGRSDVTIGYDSDDDVVRMTIEVFHPTLTNAFKLRSVGARLPRSGELGARQLVSDPELDAAVELAGASRSLVAALRADPDLKKRTLAVIRDLGAVLDDRHLSIVRTRFAQTTDELRALVVPMIELVHRLERPNGFHASPLRGSDWTVRFRLAKQGGSDATRAAAIAFLEALAPGFGGATVFAPEGESDVELRGSYRGHPLRIEIDSRLSPELTIKRPSQGTTLYLEQDPDIDADDAHPPAWDDRSDAKLFLGRTTYVEGARADLDRVRAELAAMPESLRTALGTELAKNGVRYFRPDAEQVWVMFWPTLDEMSEPVTCLEETLGWMLAVSEHRGAHPLPPEPRDDDDEDDASSSADDDA